MSTASRCTYGGGQKVYSSSITTTTATHEHKGNSFIRRVLLLVRDELAVCDAEEAPASSDKSPLSRRMSSHLLSTASLTRHHNLRLTLTPSPRTTKLQSTCSFLTDYGGSFKHSHNKTTWLGG